MALVNIHIKDAKPRDKDYKLYDGGGMYLLVKKNGNKYWRMDYRFRGKRKTIALGIYPQVSLKDAREKLRSAKIQISNDQDPSAVRKEEKRAQKMYHFEAVARQWWDHYRATWTPTHAARVLKRLEDNAFADLGYLTIDEITPMQVIATIRKIEARDALDVANRVKQAIKAICRFGIQTASPPVTLPATWTAFLDKGKCNITLPCPGKSYSDFSGSWKSIAVAC